MHQFEQLLAAGKLEEAIAHCQGWLAREPNSDIAANSLGLVLAKQGKMQEAADCFKRAIETSPDNIVYHDNLSNAYLALGKIDQAKQHLHQALQINPHHAESYNNLGRLFYKQSLFEDAIHYLEKALRLNPNYWEAHYNLAHSHAKMNHLSQAAVHYKEVLRLMPNHPTAHHNLGLLLFEEGNVEAAIPHLEEALIQIPDNIEAARFLGYAELARGNIESAITAFERTIQLSDAYPDVWHNLGVLYLRLDKRDKALASFERTLQLDPTDDTARHMFLALKGEQSLEAPTQYIADLFDQYADYYNRHVKEKLSYAVPGLLRNAVGRSIPRTQKAGRVLDIGCGTGLCGVFFRDLAFELIGVDLSPKMVDWARQLGAYDNIIISDYIDYLHQSNIPNFDLIIAGDVLVYRGDLESSFDAISNKLAKNGLFAFTVERWDGSLFHLKPTGRYAHSNQYIHDLATKHGFLITLEEDITPRQHEGKPVPGGLYVLRKNA